MDHEKDAVPAQPLAEASRKEFLKKSGTVAAGAAILAAGAPALVEAAGVEKPRVLRDLSPVTVTMSRGQVTGAFDPMAVVVKRFEKANPNIKVNTLFAPTSSSDAHNQYVAQLSGGSATVDLYDCDVIWPPEFAAAGWILPVDKYIDEKFRSDLLPGPLLGTKVNGKMYAFPNRTDSGLLAYRTDLLAKYKLAPPKTWAQLVTAAQTVMKHEKGVTVGMLWQGAQYEGLFCDVSELFWQNGGNVLQNYTGKPIINSANNRQALQFMVDTIWKYKISPLSVVTYKEPDCVNVWNSGKAVFMRNWPYIWGTDQSNNPKSKVAHKFQMIPLPHGPNGKSAGCLGGWNYAINAKTKHAAEAAKLALYLTSYDTQKYLTIQSGTEPTRASLYHDPDVLAKVPYFKSFYDVVRRALPRPVSKYEVQISDRVTKQVNAALKRQVSVSDALKNAQRDIESIMGGGNTP